MAHPRYDANEHISWKNVVAKNFIGGIMWGLGSVIGASLVLSFLLGTLHQLDFIPFIADAIIRIQNIIEFRR